MKNADDVLLRLRHKLSGDLADHKDIVLARTIINNIQQAYHELERDTESFDYILGSIQYELDEVIDSGADEF